MKKLIAMLLCLAMVAALFAGCNNGGGDPTDGTTTAPTGGTTTPLETTVPPTEATLADAEEITAEPLYYLGFEDDTNITGKIQDRDNAVSDPNLDGATYQMIDYNGQILHTNGPVGQCLYLDGNYGIKLENLVAPTDETYTISFWVNASRLADFMPSLQIGRNIGGAPSATKEVTWINVTQTNFFGTGAAFPTIWNRSSGIDLDANGVLDYDGTNDIPDDGVWPWANKLDDTVYGKNEWIMVTIVANGTEYNHVDAATGAVEPRIATTYYLNGVQIMNANETEMTYHGLSPKIFIGEGLEGYLGINFWDYTMKGFFDELYIYDEALTAGQVATLWAQGDATVESVVPEAGATEDPTAPVDTNAIDSVGTTDMLCGWWTDWSKSWELAEGASVTVKLNNYSLGGGNWNNYVIAFVNGATPGHAAPADSVDGYAEYAVVRADLYGWGDASYALTTECNWLTSDNADADWTAWRTSMTDADVTLVISRSNGVITIDATMVCSDGNTYTSKEVVTSTLTADGACHFFFVSDACYLEVLSVE